MRSVCASAHESSFRWDQQFLLYECLQRTSGSFVFSPCCFYVPILKVAYADLILSMKIIPVIKVVSSCVEARRPTLVVGDPSVCALEGVIIFYGEP